ncbi:hypothetical protein Ae201684P_021818 [Aphanomyces euteiches]|uniref:Cysteine/serine-rich nuclear protein N-terminal domain-containing protein n=1 Tax=Aphanomyces euteiches TaxID=100861 RepID=A0A6G0WSV7_9STRA|nr:hypothetical protein Ae201684_011945 [Aphanomyces euteiches]KAH9056079.1 hypothetical protein Ae201684P_021818 [Aphanomyces euteiches]KAH9139044.1 hypothetical protein AeRB84_016640 [Aphanomyces euteiches]
MPETTCVVSWPTPASLDAPTWTPVAFLKKMVPREKQVSFTTVTTYTFPLEYGGSAIPRDHGPPIGLAKVHSRQECQHVDGIKAKRSRVRRFNHVERMILLQEKASYTRNEVARFCFESIAVQKSRQDTNELTDDDEDDDAQNVVKKRRIAES